ncbi:hypothetical protein ACYJ1Y_08500 [Natrialbaceae archaeon A-gly3]
MDCQLVLRNDETGLERFEYYCNAHLVSRVWELEEETSLEPVGATRL